MSRPAKFPHGWDGRERERYNVRRPVSFKACDPLRAGQVAATGIHTSPIGLKLGFVRFIDFVEGVTVFEKTDELTGLASSEITDPKRRGSAGKDLRPIVRIVDGKGKDLSIPGTDLPAQYLLPPRSLITLQDGAPVGVGDVVARIPQEASQTRDHHRRFAASCRSFRVAQPGSRDSWLSAQA